MKAKNAKARQSHGLQKLKIPDLQTSLHVDASDKAIGAVLQQLHDDIWKPIAFFSRKLDATQQRYSTFDRELLAAYKAVNHFHYLVEGRAFTLWSDHKPLIAAFHSKCDQLIGRRARKLSFISEFTTDVRHVRGDKNVIADALSRLEIDRIVFTRDALDYNEIAPAQRDDNDITAWWRGSCPTSLILKEYLLDGSNISLICDTSTGKVRPVVPRKFQRLVFHKIHDLSHPGIKATSELIRQRFVWNQMKRDIKTWVRSCVTCQKGKIIRNNRAPLQRFTLPSERFLHIHADIVGPLPSSNRFRYLLTVIDRFSRWCTATPMKEVSAATTADALMQGWIPYYRVPNTITTDRGTQFTSQIWKDLMIFLGTKHITTTSFYPQSNGILEIVHRRLKDALRMQSNPINWYNNLPLVGPTSVSPVSYQRRT